MAYLKCKFYLKYPKNEFSSVFLRINHKPFRPFKYYLAAPAMQQLISIPTICWDSKTQKPKRSIPLKYQLYTASIGLLKTLITQIEGHIEYIKTNASINNIELNNNYLKTELNKKIGVKEEIEESTTISLVEYYEQKITGMKDGSFVQPKNGKKYGEGTIESHITCKKCLQGFDIFRNKKTFFDNIDNIWYDDYIKFLNEEQEIFDSEGNFDFFKKELAINTIGSKHIKNLKFIMERALKDGISFSLEYKKDYFIRPKEPTFAIALNEKELRAIYDTKALDEKEQIAKDLFLVGAYTCLRYSDFSVITPDNFKIIDGVEVVEKATQKTKDRAIIPILWDELKEIVKRYEYRLPYISSQSLNELIKNIGERAGITHIEEYHQTVGGETKLIQEPRYKLIASHTARRSAATNLIRRKYSYDEVRLLTGHKTNQQLQEYIKLGRENNALSMAKDFNRNNKNI